MTSTSQPFAVVTGGSRGRSKALGTLTAVIGLLAALSTLVLFASDASAASAPDPTRAPSPPTLAPVSGSFPMWTVVLTVVVALVLILAGAAFNVRMHHARPWPAEPSPTSRLPERLAGRSARAGDRVGSNQSGGDDLPRGGLPTIVPVSRTGLARPNATRPSPLPAPTP